MNDTTSRPVEDSLLTSPSPETPASTGSRKTPRKQSSFRRYGFRNTVLAKSRKDASGQISITRRGIYVDGTAGQILKKLEEASGSRMDLLEKLEAVEEKLDDPTRQLMAYLSDLRNDRFPLARLVAEAGCSPVQLLKRYMEGAMFLGKVEAAVAAAKEQPRIIRELTRHAFIREGLCKTCIGTGFVYGPHAAAGSPPRHPCSVCAGKGKAEEESAHLEFAMEQLIDIAQMKPQKGPLVDVKVQNNSLTIGAGLMERVLKMSEETLYGSPTVEADVLESSGRKGEGEAGAAEGHSAPGALPDAGLGLPAEAVEAELAGPGPK